MFENRFRTQVGSPLNILENVTGEDMKDSMSNSMLQFVQTYGIAVQKAADPM